MIEYLITYEAPWGQNRISEVRGVVCKLDELPTYLKRLEKSRDEGYKYIGIKRREKTPGMYIDEGWEDFS